MSLPKGWVQSRSRSTGGIYYCHVETKRTQWHFPVSFDQESPDRKDLLQCIECGGCFAPKWFAKSYEVGFLPGILGMSLVQTVPSARESNCIPSFRKQVVTVKGLDYGEQAEKCGRIRVGDVIVAVRV